MIAEVRLWGRTIGAVSMPQTDSFASFEYDSDFAQSGIEVSPLVRPLSRRIYQYTDLPLRTFHGLPGLLADSLPDKFGNALINAWLASQGRTPEAFNAVERLCYIGSRGMGALEFAPATGPAQPVANRLHIDALVSLASEMLASRKKFQASLTNSETAKAVRDIYLVGTSAAGARAKAVIAWNPKTGEIRSGQVATDEGFEYWLLKFDGVSGNRDKDLEDPKGYCAIEYAYHLMACAAGITMAECRLLEENGRRHFMTKRFDRLPGGEKLHMQSLCALAHFDFNQAGAHSYEQALQILHRLNLPANSIEQQFRRMVFNIMARNQDDHVKNIAYLMDKQGHWTLAPAFDVTYNFNPSGNWTANHQMTLNGKRVGFSIADFKACARNALMKRGRAETIIEEVRVAVAKWPDFASEAKVSLDWVQVIQKNLRLSFPQS